uniref:CMP-N-acetylneuraminate-beta-galactosamide- alpha-2,3-sialyltransferase 2 n=1 Tax=Doryrhamphus excisus TaxID=161450 RepID=UPI0025ADE584|nr:CMP-N-acetylneuraminate-beta-galactosamide-alpha-2,3-sialyltransferase 2 [Doryrhamphus excisus]
MNEMELKDGSGCDGIPDGPDLLPFAAPPPPPVFIPLSLPSSRLEWELCRDSTTQAGKTAKQSRISPLDSASTALNQEVRTRSAGLGTLAGPAAGAWPWGGRIPSSSLHRDRRWGFWGGGPFRGTTSRLSELRPWLGRGHNAEGGGADGRRVRCSRRVLVLLGSLVLVFLTSLFFSVSLRGSVGFNYLDPPGWEESRRVKLVPSYVGAHKLSPPDAQQQKTCACPRCVGDPGVSDWFDENYDPDISPVWTRDNIQLPSDVYYWWVMLQPQFKPHSIQQVLLRLFQVIPGRSPYGSWDPGRCLRCAVVGNSGNLRGAGYGATIDEHNYIMRINLAPTVGYEEDVGSRTTHHFMYPESAKNLAANVSFVLVPFKTLDLVWITSALSTGQIRFTYAPVKQFLRVDKDKVQVFNPAFFKYIHDHWTRHHGRYPSTGMLVLFFALHVCDEVNVFGFGADSRGNWHHYWEQNRYAGEFRKTGVHDADFEAQIIQRLAQAGKITVFPGK